MKRAALPARPFSNGCDGPQAFFGAPIMNMLW